MATHHQHTWRHLGVTALTLALAVGCRRAGVPSDGSSSAPVRLGYEPGPHAAVVYTAEAWFERTPSPPAFSTVPFKSSSDIAYALIAGSLDAGFIETTRAQALLAAVDGLQAAGAITFPTGASLILRKDLDLRIDALGGRTVGVADLRCRMLNAFTTDAERLGVDRHALRIVPLPFNQMLPALEARKVDAILTQGGVAMLAVERDHSILYQNWAVTGDDPCCPDTLEQIESVLVVRTNSLGHDRLQRLIHALQAAEARPPAERRAAVINRTGLPEAMIQAFPVAAFVVLTPEAAHPGREHPVPAPPPHRHVCEDPACEHPHEH